MRRRMARQAVGVVAGLAMALAVGCSDDGTPAGLESPGASLAQAYPAPGGLVAVGDLDLYPYTLNHYVADNQDPINLIFTGHANPLMLRAALMGLDGDRSAYLPPELSGLPFFQCTWKDALGGDEQVAYGGDMWAGSVVQLACGDYGPLRFHLRLFPVGDHTIANAHFELMIPGTADHQVLSWELAEQLVMVDMIRTGIAAPDAPAAGINDAPTFRWIPAVIWAGVVSEGLDQLVYPGVSPLEDADGNVGIPTDGTATVFNVMGEVPLVPGTFEQQLTLPYQVIAPKPICNPDRSKYIAIGGSVDLWQVDVLTETGEYSREFRASGELVVSPVDPATGQLGEPQRALVQQEQSAKFWPGMASTSRRFTQTVVPVASAEGGRSSMFLQWGPNGRTKYDASEQCGM
jgi:hypothetical protein